MICGMSNRDDCYYSRYTTWINWLPKFIDAIHRINNSGYDGDYISDNFIRSTRFKDGQLVTSGGTGYKSIGSACCTPNAE